MELYNIEKLLEKYFEGNTSVSEEKELGDYFQGEDVATHLLRYKPIFNYFSEAREEKYTKQVPLKPRTHGNMYRWISVAAAVFLTFGIYFGKQYQDRKQLEREQAEYAYEQTLRAFDLLAENFDRGREKVAYLKEFEQAKQKIYNDN